jgi:prevent-host-death family protein
MYYLEAIMEYVRIRKTDLARNTSRIIRNVLRGQPAVIESHGQPEVAIVDVADYLILRAVARYHENPPSIHPDGLTDNDADRLTDTQERYNVVMAHYLAGAISTGRTAELLGLPWIELRERFRRLDVPIHLGSNSVEEARQELNSLRKYSTPGES